MRLQLALLVLLAAPHAHADPEGERATIIVRESGYFDNDATTISTTIVSIRAKPLGDFILNMRYVADAVSSASIDVVTAATDRWTELRSEAAGGVAFADGTTTASIDYVYSHEKDWDSHTIAVGGSRDLFQHNLTLGGGASAVTNAVGRADDPNFAERQRAFGGSLRVVWVANPRNIFQTSYDLSRVTGYQESPYRFAFVAGPVGMRLAFPESAPDTRLRNAVTVRWNRHVGEDSALRSHLRGYADDWGVQSITTGTEFVVGLRPFEVAANARFYVQRGASFYQDVYSEPREFMTADRELSTFQDVFAGVRAAWIGERLMFDAGLTGFVFRFPEFSRLPQRTGLVASLGLVLAL